MSPHGFLLEGFFENAVRSPMLATANLAAVGAPFLVVEAAAKWNGARWQAGSWRSSVSGSSRRRPWCRAPPALRHHHARTLLRATEVGGDPARQVTAQKRMAEPADGKHTS
jgi:hypothetical protein